MKKILLAVIALIMTAGAVSAQQYMYVWMKDGTHQSYPVSDLDSVGFYMPENIGGNTGGIGVFSVSATKKVTFSKGNLQYQASTDTWRFAEIQWDIVGMGYGQTDPSEKIYCYVGGTVENGDNRNISSTYTGWIDLFGWGTGNAPINKSEDNSDYSSFVDWGVNPISNGGNMANQWRTLTQAEWGYLMSTRTGASNKYGAAKVNDITGVVILPDDWTSAPAGCSFTPGMTSASNWDDWSLVASTNIYNGTQWQAMEESGAVFLPAAGWRSGTSVQSTGLYGYYWSSVQYNDPAFASDLYFRTEYLIPESNTYCFSGLSVRLVQDIQD